MFESLIEFQARSKPKCIARFFGFPQNNSSFTLSNTSTFASVAIPIDRINPAIPGRVRTTGTNLNIANVRTEYIKRAIPASTPSLPYLNIKNKTTSSSPTPAAKKLF